MSDTKDLPPRYRFHPEFERTPRQIAEGRERVLLVDVREPGELKAASLDHDLHLRMGEFEDRFDELLDLAQEHTDREIVFLCHHGVRSRQITLAARAMGLTNAWSLAGGIDWWSASINPAIPRY